MFEVLRTVCISNRYRPRSLFPNSSASQGLFQEEFRRGPRVTRSHSHSIFSSGTAIDSDKLWYVKGSALPSKRLGPGSKFWSKKRSCRSSHFIQFFGLQSSIIFKVLSDPQKWHRRKIHPCKYSVDRKRKFLR